ncbi:MAG: restriction endonuclease subunit S [Saprospiraceae bacterium]
MELVAKKFKHTELGLIPIDWEVKNLLENFTLKARIGWQGLTTAEYLEIGDFGLVTGTDFKNGYIDWDNCVYVERARFVQDKNIQLKIFDVLVTKDGTIGKVAFIDKLPNPTTLNSGVFVIRPKNENIDNRFFYYLLMSFYFDNFLSKITAGSTITHLYQKDFVTFNFILPAKAEQTAIATALSDADALISGLVKLLTKKRNIKQGAMQKLLQPKEGWEVKKLGEKADIFRGGSPRPIEDYLTIHPDGINWIKIGDVKKNAKYIESTDEKIIPEGLSRSRFVNEGDFLLSNSMSFGRPYILKIKGCIHDGWLVIQNYQDHFDRDFLYYVLGSEAILQQYKSMASGSSVLNLNKEIVKNVIINCPKSVDEQAGIAKVLSDMDEEIISLETKLEKYRNVKSGMMQNLLTGKIRLN